VTSAAAPWAARASAGDHRRLSRDAQRPGGDAARGSGRPGPRGASAKLCKRTGIRPRIERERSFRPGAPNPTMRLDQVEVSADPMPVTDRPNLLLVCVDQWRADCLSAAGNPVVSTRPRQRWPARGWRSTAPTRPAVVHRRPGLAAYRYHPGPARVRRLPRRRHLGTIR
jgi:hypothetical protein